MTVTGSRARPVRPPRDASENSREEWLDAMVERLDPFMAWLGVIFALMLGYELAVPLSPSATQTLRIVGWVIWAVFLGDFLLRLWLAPRWFHYLRRNWLSLAMLLVPTLRALRFIRLVRLGRALPAARVISTTYRAAGTARTLLGSRLGYLAGLATVAVIAVAELAYVFERHERIGRFPTFWDALVWGATTVIAMSPDPVPVSLGARLTMIVGLLVSLTVIGTVAGSVGAYLLEDRRERSSQPSDE